MQRKIITTGILFIFLLIGCASQQAIHSDKKWSPIYRLHVVTNKGGIVENTDMTVVDNSGNRFPKVWDNFSVLSIERGKRR